MHCRPIQLTLLFVLPLTLGAASASAEDSRPNMVVILADDMGYGDVTAFNKDSKIPTPNLDRLASQGMMLTDAHSPGSWCIPTRYGLLTGNYPHRAKEQPGKLLDGHATTVAEFLSRHGYQTGFVGKWHLGVDFESDDGLALKSGPHKVGFDYSFGIPASLDIPPYYYYENGKALARPTGRIGDNNSDPADWTNIQGAFWRGGGNAPGFRHQEVLPTITRKAVDFIDSQATSKPYFLYFAMTAPHTPWLPLKEFAGKSGAGMYGDFVMQVDAAVGAVMDAVEKSGAAKNTIVVFTSDNGPVWYPKDIHKYQHDATGPYSGMKADLWEGGHRVPTVVRWPARIAAGSQSDALFCHTDLFRTFASVIGKDVPEADALDSVDQLSMLTGAKLESSPRQDLIIYRNRGNVMVRDGSYVLIPLKTAGGFTKMKPAKDAPPGQLYDLSNDPGEKDNLWNAQPARVQRMLKLFPAAAMPKVQAK